MLLGRRPEGSTFVDWCNIDRCKRVKPFRCGELDFDQRINNALALSAATNQTAWNYNKGRNARMEDAILQALDIERERAVEPASKAYLHGGTCSPNPKIEMPNGLVKDAAAKDPSTAIQSPSPPPKRRKRKTPYDSEEDAPKGSRRMRDLRDIGSKAVPPMDVPHAGTISVPKYDDLPNVGQVKTSVPSHASTKRKHAAAPQDQPCGNPRKKDRSRPLSELCNGDMWNGSRSNGHKSDEHIVGVATCSSSSSGTSTLDSSLDTTSCHRHVTFKTDQAKGTEISCVTRLLTDDSCHGGDFVETPLAGRSVLEPAEQQHSKIKRDPEESSETMSSPSNCDSGSVSSLGFEIPLQVLPPQKKSFDLERCHAVKPIKTLHLNSTLYDVKLSVLGSSNKGRRVPLVSLMSTWNRKPVVGYPVSVEILDDVFGLPLSSRDEPHPATNNEGGIIPKRDKTQGLQRVVPSSPQVCRAKPKSRSRKPLEKDIDKLWQPHTKKPAASSSRKMRRISSFALGQRDGDNRKSAVGKVSGATIACIPLRVVFSRINEALTFPVK
nr:unnamed protein product [Digitaria exilis]